MKFLVFYLAGGLAADALQIVIDPCSPIPTLGASGAVSAVSAATSCFYPRARVVTLIFIVIFFTIIELPAMVVLGLWFLQQVFFGVLDYARPTRRGAAWRTSRTSAGSSSGC